MSASIPIILCGATVAIGSGVKASLLPEYETIHMILTPAAGASEIPIILQGKTPPPSDAEQIGTKNYSKPAKVVVMGGGYDDEKIELMRSACEGVSKVPWLRADLTVPTPPLGPEYGAAMVKRVKDCLKSLAEQGKMEEDGIHFY